MKTNIFDSFYPILKTCVFINIQARLLHEWYPRRCRHVALTIVMKKPAAAALNTRIALYLKLKRARKEGKLASDCEVVNFLLETYATDDIIEEMDAVILYFEQPSHTPPTEYLEALWNKAQRCDRTHDEYVFMGIFLEACHGWIQQSMNPSWSSKKMMYCMIMHIM